MLLHTIVSIVKAVVAGPVNLLQLQEQLDPLHWHPGLHQSIDDPGKGIQRTDQHIEQSNTGKHLDRQLGEKEHNT